MLEVLKSLIEADRERMRADPYEDQLLGRIRDLEARVAAVREAKSLEEALRAVG